MITVEGLQKLGFRNVKQVGENIMMSCPLGIHEDKSPSFGINVGGDSGSYGKWGCFSCGNAGNSIKSLADRIHKPELLRMFEYTSSDDLFREIDKRLNYQEHILRFEDSKDYLVDYYKLNYKDEYLKQRGITEEVAKMFDIGFDPIQNAVTLPIYNENKELQGFTYRLLDNKMRYLHEVEKSKTVYGAQFLTEGVVTVVEGNFDVLRAYSLGLKNVVGIMGTKLSKDQEAIIKKYATKVVLALDNDFNKPKNWGRIATEKIGNYLTKSGLRLSVIEYPKGVKDFGDLLSLNYKETNYMEWRLNCIMQKP